MEQISSSFVEHGIVGCVLACLFIFLAWLIKWLLKYCTDQAESHKQERAAWEVRSQQQIDDFRADIKQIIQDIRK